MRKLAFGLALVAALSSCSFFSANKTGSGLGALVIQISPLGQGANGAPARGARTVLPGIAAAADTYTITLSNNSAYPGVTRSMSFDSSGLAKGAGNKPVAGPTCVMPDIELGSWDVKVDALKGTTLLGSGSLPGQTVTSSGGYGTPIQVSIEPVDPGLSGGSGDIFLPIVVRAWTTTSADFRLITSDGSTVVDSKSNQTFAYSSSTEAYEFTYTASAIPAANYFLEITLRVDGDTAGIYREAVTVWNAVTSDQWFDAAGNPQAAMTFQSGDLLDANSKLASLTVKDDQNNTLFTLPTSMTDYDLGLVDSSSITFTPEGSLSGSMQAMSYRWNGGEMVGILGATPSSPQQLRTGRNNLVLTVTSPDGRNSTEYRLSLECPAIIASATGHRMIQVSGGSFNRDYIAGQTSTVSTFLIGATDVTQEQYQSVMGVNPSTLYGNANFVGPQLPVIEVSWFDAIAFCNKLSVMEGLDPVYNPVVNVITDGNGSIQSADVTLVPSKNGYRLPTEAEWEFAARGGARSRGYSYSGSGYPDDVAWYGAGPGYVGPASASQSLLAVASLAPNELGLYDMSGDVFQWCWDVYGSYPSSVAKDYLGAAGVVYTSGTSGNVVARGGDYFHGPELCLVTARASKAPYLDLGPGLGFRVARNGPAGNSISVTAADGSAFSVSGPIRLPSAPAATYTWTAKGGQSGATYQWFVNGIVQAGATGAAFSLTRDSELAPPGTLFGKNRIAAIEQAGTGASASYSSSELNFEVEKPFTISGASSFMIFNSGSETYTITGAAFESSRWYVNGVEQTAEANSPTLTATWSGYAFAPGTGWITSWLSPGALNKVKALVTITINGTNYSFSDEIDVYVREGAS